VRFTYAESMTDPSFYAPLARAAEEAGYHSMVVPDSICYPKHATSRYPFSPDGTREFLEDKPFLEPFSLIPALGAVTTRLRFVTFVLKLPVRDPVLVAKQATSTAVLTGGRLVLGVGTSPWREDYDVLGVDWASRGRRMDESIAILRGLAAGGYFEHHGKVFDLPPVKISPVPDAPIPVLIGGHGDPALRRAARVGDGWLHGGGDPAALPSLLARLADARRREGTADRPFEIHVISPDAYTPDGVSRLEAQGVTDLIVGFRWPYVTGPDPEPLSQKLDHLRRYADTIITRPLPRPPDPPNLNTLPARHAPGPPGVLPGPLRAPRPVACSPARRAPRPGVLPVPACSPSRRAPVPACSPSRRAPVPACSPSRACSRPGRAPGPACSRPGVPPAPAWPPSPGVLRARGVLPARPRETTLTALFPRHRTQAPGPSNTSRHIATSSLKDHGNSELYGTFGTLKPPLISS
jgi:probable F420-dependent oxidoreductase